jgi:hypothetical protein
MTESTAAWKAQKQARKASKRGYYNHLARVLHVLSVYAKQNTGQTVYDTLRNTEPIVTLQALQRAYFDLEQCCQHGDYAPFVLASHYTEDKP